MLLKVEDYIRNGTVTFGELLLLWTKLLAVVINDVQTLKWFLLVEAYSWNYFFFKFIHTYIVMKKIFATNFLVVINYNPLHSLKWVSRSDPVSGQRYHLYRYHLRIWVFENLLEMEIILDMVKLQDQTDMIRDGRDGYWTWWTKIEVYTTHMPSTT